jgi:hypothetical protein
MTRGAMPESMTTTETLDILRRRGFSGNLVAHPEGLRMVETGRTFPPNEIVIREYYRFEGESDPDDMAIVYAIEGPDGVRGVLVDAFGVYANPAVGAALRDVGVCRSTRGVPGPGRGGE